MKKLIIIVLLFSVTIGLAQRKPKIKGSKTVVEINESLPSFNAVKVIDDLKIELRKSQSEGYLFTGDDNLIDVLKFEVVDSTLIISSFYKITSKRKLNIVINYKQLGLIQMADGRIDMKDIVTADKLEVVLNGSSKLALNVNAPIINITMSGTSDAEMNTDSDITTINLTEKANLRIYSIAQEVQLDMYNSANAKIEGSVTRFNLDLYGNSILKAEDFKAAAVKVNLDESADAKVFAAQTIDISSKGNGKTYLYGNPKISIIDFMDASQLIKK